MADDGNVQVFCRVRPPNEREGGATSFAKTCVTVPSSDPLQQTVLLQLKGVSAQAAPKMFTFDRVFHELSSQNEVFEIVGVPITKACLEGYNGTIFAYGQTGSGKTFTMQGPDDVIDTEARALTATELGLRGLVPRVFDYLFQDSSSSAMRVPVNGAAVTRVEHTFACSFMEIYNERVYDLLDQGSTRDSAGLILRENGRKGVSVEGLIESVVSNAKQAAELMAIGARNRRVGQTAMNRESSRSHSVFVLQIQSKETTADGITRTRLSRFNLVDLAGSERQKNTETVGERLKEAGSINKSLSALGNVIMGLVEQSAGKNRHVHYRDSKLTFLLKDSLGGNSKTFMIATVSPAEDSSHETLSTLKFAARAKLIRNNAVINEDTSGSVLVLQEEIVRLRRQLQEARGGSADLMADARLASDVAAAQSLPADGGGALDAGSERLLELEAALAFSLEQNEDLKRSNGQLSMRSSHLHALCADMKKSISHMRLLHRLRGRDAGDDETMVEYVPSADAIEWRMKYEDLEEAFMELQERVRDGRVSSPPHGHDSEVQKLNLMYFTLTKQLAHAIRDKHELHSRVNDTPSMDIDDSDKAAQYEAQLVSQAIEFESRLNSVCAMNAAAEEKAQAASLELLHSKQKEAAWKIEQQQSEILIAELQERVAQLEVGAASARESILQEKGRQIELEMALRQESVNAQQVFEQRLAEKMTESYELKQLRDQLRESLAEARSARDCLKRELGERDDQLNRTTQELQSVSAALKSRADDLERVTAEYSQYKHDQDTLRHGLEEKLAGSLSCNTELTAANDALRLSLKELNERSDEQTNSISKLEEEIRVRQNEKEELLRVQENFSQQINSLTLACKEFETKVAGHVTELHEKAAAIDAMMGEIALQKSVIESLTAERDQTKVELAGASQRIQDLEALESSLRGNVAQLESAVSNLEASGKDLAATLSSTKAHVAHLEATNTELTSTLVETERSLKEEQQVLSETKHNLETTTQSLAVSQQERDGLQERVHELEQTRLEQSGKIGGLEKELVKCSELLQITEETVRECKTELNECTVSYESTIAAAKRDYAELTALHESTVADHEKLLAHLEASHQDVVATIRRDSEALVKNFEAEIQQLREQIEEAESRFVVATHQHEKLVVDLRRTIGETETLLSTEKRERAAAQEHAEQRQKELVRLHDDEVTALRETGAAQERQAKATIESLNKSNDAARATIEQRDATISELDAKAASLEQDLARAESKCGELLSAIRGLKAEQTNLQSSVDALETNLAEEVSAKVAVQERAAKLDVELEVQHSLVRQHERTIAAGQELAQGLKERTEELTAERDSLLQDLEESRRVFKQAVIAHEEEVARAHDAHQSEVKRLTDDAAAAISTLESTVAMMSTELDSKKQEIVSFQREIQQYLSTVADLESRLTTEQQAKESALKELAHANAELEDRERCIIEKNECIDRANHKIEMMQEAAKEEQVRLSGRIQLLEADLTDLSRAHNVLSSSHDALTKQHADTVEEKRDVEQTNAENMQRITELTEQLDGLLARITAMAETTRNLETSLEAQIEETREWREQKEGLDKTVSDLKQRIARLDESIDEKDSVISGMEETVENLEAEKLRALEELQRATEVGAARKAELDSTSALLQTRTADLSQTKEKLKSTEHDFQAAVRAHNSVQDRLQKDLNSLSSELAVAKQLTSSQQSQLALGAEKMKNLTEEAAGLVSKSKLMEATIKANELARQAREAEHQEKEESLKISLSVMREELQRVQAAREALAVSLQTKSDELNVCERVAARTRTELAAAKEKIAALQIEAASQLAAWDQQQTKLQQQIQDSHKQLESFQQIAEEQRQQTEQMEQSFEREMLSVRQELAHTVEKAARQRKRNDTLHERNEQLAMEIEKKTAKIAENTDVISRMESELERSQAQRVACENELLETKLKLSSTSHELAELAVKHEQLSTDFDGAKDDLKAKQDEWEAKHKELRGRMTVVGEMEVQIADESKKVADEKVAVAQRKKEFEKITYEHGQFKTRVDALETQKIQLLKEKERYRREVTILNQRLNDISKEKDKLIGHDNKHQKIHHHIKVKEENNRLIEEVRQLSKEKYKLELRIEKLELTLKEKENLVNDQVPLESITPRSPTTNASHRAAQQKLHSAVPPPAAKGAEEAAMDATEGPLKKRLRSRLE